MFEKSDNIPLIKSYLIAVQSRNIEAVNNALNELYIEEEDYKSLKDSTSAYSNFDAVSLAKRLEKHELLEFRRIAAQLHIRVFISFLNRKLIPRTNAIINTRSTCSFKTNFTKMQLKQRRLLAIRRSQKICCDTLWILETRKHLPLCFSRIHSSSTCTDNSCADLVKPDVVLELGWRANLMDFAMPFMINTICEQTQKVLDLPTVSGFIANESFLHWRLG
jgi:clathrin heavy chain